MADEPTPSPKTPLTQAPKIRRSDSSMQWDRFWITLLVALVTVGLNLVVLYEIKDIKWADLEGGTGGILGGLFGTVITSSWGVMTLTVSWWFGGSHEQRGSPALRAEAQLKIGG